MKNQVSNIARAKFQAIIALQFMAVNLLAINKRAVLAPQVNDKKLAIFRHDRSVLARHPRIRNHQIAINRASHRIRSVIQRQRLLIASLYKDSDRKNAGYARMRRRRHVR
jgi:hypothetical protein